MIAKIEEIIASKNSYSNIYDCYEDCKKVLIEEKLNADEVLKNTREIAVKLGI